MREMVHRALDRAKSSGASYADVRFARFNRESIATRERRVTNISSSESYGVGVRVLVDGTWGFAASRDASPESIDATVARAIAIAKANRQAQREPVTLAPVKGYKDTWQTPVTKDPFRVPLENKIDLLFGINEAALAVKGTAFCNSSLAFVKEEKIFGSTEGAEIEQILIREMPSFTVTAIDRDAGKFKTRNGLVEPMGRGWEAIEAFPWREEATRAAEQAVEKLSARSVEAGKWDLILMPSNLWLTIHESVGHPTELDRAVGHEANYAGTSFLTPDKLGTFRFGSEVVNFFADRTQPGGLATCGYDDEGVPTREWDIVRDGIFVGYQTTREQAGWIGQKESMGTSYADSWSSVQFQRMPNLSLRPGETRLKLEELIADTRKGLIAEGRASYSIDQQRYNFQFSAQVFREVRDGKITGMVEDAAYQAVTPEFWKACDAVCSEGYELGGSFFDGKGEPGQINAVSHGCTPARFRNINVLNTARSV